MLESRRLAKVRVCRVRRIQSARAFTLIELMIVIAVIATLVAIIIPAAGRARETALRAMCMKKVGALAQASIAFAADHRGQLPNTNWVSLESRDPVGWLYKAPLSNPKPDDRKAGQLWKYLGSNGDSYFCPLFDQSVTTGSSDKLTNYLMNGAVGGYGGIPAPGTAYSLRQFPPDAVIFWEASETRFNDGSSYPTEVAQPHRHQRGATVACFDGSCDFITFEEWNLLLNQKPGRLWCSPRTSTGQ